ncbi:MAG: efflux transporter outer membrane subunit [Akkermansiaceae bacterium]|nr:efflux transporter outer membrane subunit [Akkermansiaceae bacterium]
MRKILFISALSVSLLSSCLLGPDFAGASAELPETWVNKMPPSTSEQDLTEWWAAFGDPQLSGLIAQAFDNNPDMVVAALNIARAESELRSIGASLYPTGSVGVGGSNSGSFDTSTSHGKWNGSLSISWKPDVWGKTRRQIEASMASLGSTVAASHATRTALSAQVATAYFEWISAMESLRIAKEQLAFQERTYNIVKKRFDAGMANRLDLEQARSTILSTRAQIPGHEATIRSCENALAILLGTTVDQVKLTMPTPATYNKIPRVPTGLPSEMLRRRPDVIQAEYNLHRAVANIGVAVADLFPSVSLSGSASSASGSDFAHFFSTAGWSLVGNVSQTIFNRTSLNEAVNMAEIAACSAGESYRKTVLAAFAEVEECLILYARLTNQLPQYEASVEANKKAAELSMRQYEAGTTDFLNVASAERAWLSSELNVISTRQQIRMALARLCTALGGGWR